MTDAKAAAMGSGVFVLGREAAWVSMGDGVRRQVLGHGADIMLVRLDFETGAVGAMHRHPHRQVSYVAAGAFDVTVDGETRALSAGDSFFVAGDVVHGVTCRERGTLVDVFTPAREEFIA